MTSSSERKTPEGAIRVLDPFRDLEAVVELISVAFGDRLDPAGRATLERMRRFARSGPLVQWFWAFLGKAAMAPGLVWLVDDQIVGNVSLRRSRSGGGYLIGNVVVHPDHQGQGIARALMQRAIRVVSQRGVPWVGLEVREDNEAARHLYDGLSFRQVGRTHHLIREDDEGPVEALSGAEAMRRGRRRDADALIGLMRQSIPEEQRPLVEKSPDDYRPSWERRLDHWLRCEDEVWWVVPEEGEMRGAVRAVRRSGGQPHRLEVLLSPSAGKGVASSLVRRGLKRMAGLEKPVASAVPNPRDCVLSALRAAGFREVRVLIQMKRDLKRKVSVRKAR